MTARELTLAVVSVTLVGTLAFQDRASASSRGERFQEKSVPARRTAVINIRDCMDRTLNTWFADIEAEVQKAQEAVSGRANDLTPQERVKFRAKVTDLSNRLRLEAYAEIVRMCDLVGKERGFDLVQKVDRLPVFEPNEPDLSMILERRTVVSFVPEIDITREVLDRINRERSARKK